MNPEDINTIYTLVLAVLAFAAAGICFKGYKICRIALALIGFAAGYTQLQNILEFFHIEIGEGIFPLLQVAAGLICAGLAWSAVRTGIFIAAYHIVRKEISPVLVALIAEHVEIPDWCWPLFSVAAGVAIALIIARLTAKSEKVIIMGLTAAAGGFAVISLFRQLIPMLPTDTSFMDTIPGYVWYLAKAALSVAGFMVQSKEKK
ncbi:MAG: hypothetical protein IKI75_05755 [Lachnospiraceae bacterium]|nr:hypothetical protein [Lachnospiraceae bacterium]